MIPRIKKTICVLLVCFTMLSVMLGPGATEVLAASDVTVNVSAEKQVIRGFGGMNHPAWAGDLTAAQRETAFGNGQNQLGFSILRIHVDENRNNWYKEVETAKSAVKHGAIVFASPWNPPSDMVETFNRNGDTSASQCDGRGGLSSLCMVVHPKIIWTYERRWYDQQTRLQYGSFLKVCASRLCKG